MNSFPADVIGLELFHGSRAAGLQSLDVGFSDPEWPFGPGIYMSAELDVARIYLAAGGGLYGVLVSGQKGGMIDLDRPWGEQSCLATAVGTRLLRRFGLSRPENLWGANARDFLDRVKDKAARNIFLASQGIWLLHGHLDAIEDGGRGDRGRQYLLLDPGRIQHLAFRES